MMDNEVRGISFPFRIGGRGGVVMSGQDISEQRHIKEGIMQLLGTSEWERVMTPRGLPPLANFFNNLNETTKNMAIFQITEALNVYEPRVEVMDIQIHEEEVDEEMRHIVGVTYRVLNNGEISSLAIPV
jgi:uncharacterized protein